MTAAIGPVEQNPSWAELDGRLRVLSAPTRGRETATSGRRAMRRYSRLLLVTDSAVVLASLAIATAARFGSDPAVLKVLGVGADYWWIAAFIAVSWILALTAYRSRQPNVVGSGPLEYRRVVTATSMLFGFDAIILVVLNANISRGFFVIAFPLGLLGLLLSRRAWRSWLIHRRQSGGFTSATILVGPRTDVERVIRTLRAHPGSAYRPLAVMVDGEIDAAKFEARWGLPVARSTDDLAGEVRRLGADVVIVAGQPTGEDFLRDLGWQLERTDADLLIASRLINVAGPRIHIRPSAEGMPLMHVELPSYGGGKHLTKRALDIFVAGAALLMLAPVFAVIAIVVARGNAGPVLFRQARVGRNGKSFQMIKFRSMVQNAESALPQLAEVSDGNGILFKMRDDPRVTRVGRVLRKYSLDELPQLWNVLVGEMSLVGPRPPLEPEVRQYEDHVLRRLYIKPGLTGMWQINGRSNLSWEESVRLDLYYVENWSLTGDLLILWRTIKVVLRPVGAY